MKKTWRLVVFLHERNQLKQEKKRKGILQSCNYMIFALYFLHGLNEKNILDTSIVLM